MISTIGIMAGKPVSGGGVTYDTDALAYFTACEAQGYTFPAGWKTAFDAFYVGLKTDSLYTSITEMGHLAHASVAANQVKMKTPASAFVAFTGSPVQGVNGVVFNGTTQHADTGVSMIGSTQNSAGLGVYVQTGATANSTFYIGAAAAATGNTVIGRSSATAVAVNTNGNSNGGFTILTSSIDKFLFQSRTTASTAPFYRNGTFVANGTTSSGAPISITLFLGGKNNNGTVAGRANCTLSFWIVTSVGLNATQVGNLNTRINTLLTATAGI